MHSLFALTRLLYYSYYEDKAIRATTGVTTSANSVSNKSAPVDVSGAVAAGGVEVESHAADMSGAKYTVNQVNLELLR